MAKPLRFFGGCIKAAGFCCKYKIYIYYYFFLVGQAKVSTSKAEVKPVKVVPGHQLFESSQLFSVVVSFWHQSFRSPVVSYSSRSLLIDAEISFPIWKL